MAQMICRPRENRFKKPFKIQEIFLPHVASNNIISAWQSRCFSAMPGAERKAGWLMAEGVTTKKNGTPNKDLDG